MKRLRKGQGIALSTWLGCIEETDRKLAGFKIWCDFYNCNMTPDEAVEIVKRG
tara:strand:+ start:2243 stop:2401 length:159 start_codon:yes stop_codon:yes gene_type:complete